MKLLFVGVAAAVIAAVGCANAADMPLPMVSKAPPLPVALPYTWTSCYVGGNVGFGGGSKTYQDAPGGYVVDPYNGVASVTQGMGGAIGGGQVGCDYQFAPHFVIGLQGNFDAASFTGSAVDNINSNYPTTFNAKANSLFGAIGRLGYADGPFLVYVDGGAAWVHDQYGATVTPSICGSCSSPFSYSVPSETRTGGVAGFGVEMLVMPNLSVFTEFDHYFFGTRSLAFSCTLSTCGGRALNTSTLRRI